MAYTIKKSDHIIDEVRIEENGKELVLNVDLYIDDILKDFNGCMKAVQEAQNLADTEDGYRKLMFAAASVFNLIFGEEQTSKLVEFYNGRVLTLLRDFLPYINEVIIPRVKEEQKGIAADYKKWMR